jgi:hypothetical protein
MALTKAKLIPRTSADMVEKVEEAYASESPLDAHRPDAIMTSKAYLALKS